MPLILTGLIWVATPAEVAQMIGLDPEECRRPEFAAIFSGNVPVPQGVRPYAQNYGGHQFGMVLRRCVSRSEIHWLFHMQPVSPAATQTPAYDTGLPGQLCYL